MNSFFELLCRIKSISIYKNLLNDPVVSGFCELFEYLQTFSANVLIPSEIFATYAEICHQLYESEFSGDLSAYLYSLILYDENCFSLACSQNTEPNELLRDAANEDILTICKLAAISSDELKDFFVDCMPDCVDIIKNLPKYKNNNQLVAPLGTVDKVIKFYKNNGCGVFAKNIAMICAENTALSKVIGLDEIKLSDLKLYEEQKNAVIENTQAFLLDAPFNNVLLYGDRGCGKSSTVKALLNEYKNQKLRIVQLAKNNLSEYGNLVQKLSSLPFKFIVFIDDLTFDENDRNFSSLKAILEGSLYKQPKNIAVYATTNRRHLIKESFSARKGDEIHLSDTIDETLSLSDRFGLVITYSSLRKDNYLEIVRLLALDRYKSFDEIELYKAAERFALEKASRSPRIAQQFLDSFSSSIIA